VPENSQKFDYYVYAYYEQHGTEPFYIGKGRGTRATCHLESENLKKNFPFYRKLRSLIESPRIEYLYENLSETEALELEIQTIAFYGRYEEGGCLLNLTDGGEGWSGRIHTKTSRERMSKSAIGNKNAAGVIKGRKPIVAKSCGIIVHRYNYIGEVRKDGFNPPTISGVLNGHRALAYGLDWEYV
jgi:hypothetical protein